MSTLKIKNNIGSELKLVHKDNQPSKTIDTTDISYTRATVDELRDLVATDGEVCVLTDKDRGGTFVYDSTATDNDGTIFGKWVRQYTGAVNVKWFTDLDPSTSTKQEKRITVQKAIDSGAKHIIIHEDWNGTHDAVTYIGGFYDYYDTTDNSALYDDRIELSKLTNTENVVIELYDRGTKTKVMNGHNSSGIVNEEILKGSGFHQGLILDTDNRLPAGTLGAGQVHSNRTSIVYRNDSISKWQIANDIEALSHDGLSVYKSNIGKQVMYFHETGKIRIGRRASIQDYSEPVYNTSICGSMSIDQDDTTDLLFNMRILESSKLEGATPLTGGAVDDGSNKAVVLYSNYYRLNKTGTVEQSTNGSVQVWQDTGFFRYGNRGFNDYTTPKEKHTFNGSISINENVGANPTLIFRTQVAGVSESEPLGTDAIEAKFLLVQGTGEIRYYTPSSALSYVVYESGDILMNYGLTVNGSVVKLPNLPTTDPLVAGQLWNNSGVVTVSAG